MILLKTFACVPKSPATKSYCKAPIISQLNPPKQEGVCDKCGGPVVQRDDDKEDAVRQRLDIYYANAEVVLNHYAKDAKLRVEKAGDKIGRTSKEVTADLIRDLK